MRDGMPPFCAYVIWVSFWSIHLMKSAAACWFFDAFGMPSSQLPIMPTPLPLGPFGDRLEPDLADRPWNPWSDDGRVDLAGQVVDW